MTRTFESSSSDATYVAQFDPSTRQGSCNCPGWRFKRAGGARTCKHVQQLEREVGAEPTQAPLPTPPPAAAPIAATTEPAAARVSPMLASAMTKTRLSDYLNDRYLMGVKWDGQRLTFRKAGDVVDGWSRPRSGKEPLTCDLLTPALLAAIRQLPDGLYDGELYVPGGKSWTVARLDQAHNRRIVIFDVLELNGVSTMGLSQVERNQAVVLAVAHHVQQSSAPLISAELLVPVSDAAIQAVWDAGGEGVIIKAKSATYRPGKRSAEWIKVKQTGSDVWTIVGFERGKAASSTPWSVTKLRHDDGRETTVTTLNNAIVADVAKDPAKYIGKRLVIKFTELTDTGSPRHGGWDHIAGDSE